MSLNEPERQALGSIEDGLAGADPRLASVLNIFSWLAAGEEMPAGEKIRVRRRRPTGRRPRRARRHPRRSGVLPQARRLYPRLGRQQAMLLLWIVITAALLAVALVLNTSGHNASCIRSAGTACPSPRPAAAPVAPSGEGSPRSDIPPGLLTITPSSAPFTELPLALGHHRRRAADASPAPHVPGHARPSPTASAVSRRAGTVITEHTPTIDTASL